MSGVFLGCKTRVQNFCSMQKFSLTMQKNFEGYLMIFKNSSRHQSLYEKTLDKEGKNA